MTRNEMNLVNMFKAVDWFLDANNELLKTFQPIIESHERLKQGLLVIDELSEAQAKDTKVQTELKSNEKDELDRTMIKVSDAMSAVAAATNNQELKLIANWPKSLLNRLREGDYYIKVQQIYKAALPLASQLLVWGVSADEIEALNTLSTSFQKRTPDIRNVKVVSKQASTELRSKVAELNLEIKDTLDKLLKPFSNLNPTLYGQYTNARSIVEKAATQAKPKDEATTVETK
jgi:hypothetical protein